MPKVVIVDRNGTRHVFPEGFDPSKAAEIVRNSYAAEETPQAHATASVDAPVSNIPDSAADPEGLAMKGAALATANEWARPVVAAVGKGIEKVALAPKILGASIGASTGAAASAAMGASPFMGAGIGGSTGGFLGNQIAQPIRATGQFINQAFSKDTPIYTPQEAQESVDLARRAATAAGSRHTIPEMVPIRAQEAIDAANRVVAPGAAKPLPAGRTAVNFGFQKLLPAAGAAMTGYAVLQRAKQAYDEGVDQGTPLAASGATGDMTHDRSIIEHATPTGNSPFVPGIAQMGQALSGMYQALMSRGAPAVATAAVEPVVAASTPLRLSAGARPMGPAPDASFVRGVPAEPATVVPPVRPDRLALPPARTIMGESGPDRSFVRGVPAQYGEKVEGFQPPATAAPAKTTPAPATAKTAPRVTTKADAESLYRTLSKKAILTPEEEATLRNLQMIVGKRASEMGRYYAAGGKK